MTPSHYKRLTWGIAACFAASFVTIAASSPQPRFLWNASASAPLGLYYVDRVRDPVRGDLVAIDPDPAIAAYLAKRRYLPSGIPLLKQIAALPGDRICRFSIFVTINAAPVAVAKTHDRQGRPLPVWYGCRRLEDKELFLLNSKPDSLDGRYFGVTNDSGIIGRAHPLLTRDAPDRPLRWRSLRNFLLISLQPKEPST